MKLLGSALVAAALIVGGCEKDGGLSSKESGALRKEERSLLVDLPAGNVALFGGNYLKLQDFLQNSAFSKLMGALEAMQPGMKEWTRCFTATGARSLSMMGALSYDDAGLTMRYVMKGFGLDDVTACADKAGFAVRVDPDKKFIAVDMQSALGPMTVGYLVLADGALLTMQSMPLPPAVAAPASTRREELEAVVAAAATRNATADAGLVAELARVDRSHAVWLVGDAAGTPVADKVGLVRGWFDVKDGFAFDFSVQVKDQTIADQITKGVPEARRQAGQLGGELGAVLKALRFERKDDRLRFALAVSNRQIEALLGQLAPFMGAAGGAP